MGGGGGGVGGEVRGYISNSRFVIETGITHNKFVKIKRSVDYFKKQKTYFNRIFFKLTPVIKTSLT